jgi:DNA transposition AAA+ family ATPase
MKMNRASEVLCAETSDFLVTKEYRRFLEFCNACQRQRYIGLCYGPPGVGKTVSARYYARWHLLEHRLPRDRPYLPLPLEIASCHTLFYTPEVTNTPRSIKEESTERRLMLNRFVEEAARGAGDPPSMGAPLDQCQLIVVDEVDRLKMSALEQLRDIYDRSAMGLVLIGLPGLEKRMSRYAQLSSRVGFAHEFRALSPEEMQFILEHHWERFGLRLEHTDFSASEAVAAIGRITGGNFRLLQRLFAQIGRILQINGLSSLTREVVEAARECLVIGLT